MKKKKAYGHGPGTFSCHEALHMALFLAGTVETELANHAALMLKPKWRKLADESAEKLHELYQAIGKEHC